MAGALINELYPASAGLGDKRLVIVSVMPCTAKKYEAQDLGDVDFVLTTRELSALWQRFGIDFDALVDRAPLDAPFAEATGAARSVRRHRRSDRGGSADGGRHVRGRRARRSAHRGSRLGRVEGFTLDVADITLKLAVVNGLGRLARP